MASLPAALSADPGQLCTPGVDPTPLEDGPSLPALLGVGGAYGTSSVMDNFLGRHLLSFCKPGAALHPARARLLPSPLPNGRALKASADKLQAARLELEKRRERASKHVHEASVKILTVCGFFSRGARPMWLQSSYHPIV